MGREGELDDSKEELKNWYFWCESVRAQFSTVESSCKKQQKEKHFANEKAKNTRTWRSQRWKENIFFTAIAGHFGSRRSTREGFGFASRHRNVCQLKMNLLFALLSAWVVITCVSLFPSSLNFLLDQSSYFIFKLFVPVNDWMFSSKALLKPEGTGSKEQGQFWGQITDSWRTFF